MVHIKRSGMLVGVILMALVLGLFATPVATTTAQAGPRLTVTPNNPMQNESVVVQGDGFLPGEPVTFWQTFPDFTVYPMGYHSADSTGSLEFDWNLDHTFPIGHQFVSGRGNVSGAIAITEFELVADPGPTPDPDVKLEVTAQGNRQQGDIFIFFGSGYGDGEKVSLWITFPDGSVKQLTRLETNKGAFSYSLIFGGLAPEGVYRLTALGLGSGRAGVVVFTLNRGDFLGAPAGNATLQACLINDEYPDGEPCVSEGEQLEFVALDGRGFTPGELVSLWLTMPSGESYDLYQGVAPSGEFREILNLPAIVYGTELERRPGLPIGRHFFNAYGHLSEQRAIAPFDLYAGSGF